MPYACTVEAAEVRAAIVDLKEQLRDLKRAGGPALRIEALDVEIAEKQKAQRDLENKAAEIDAATFDLKAVNPRAVVKKDNRTPEQIIQSIEDQGKIVSDALARLRALLAESESIPA